MRIKKVHFILAFSILVLSILLISCVTEPTITPFARPTSLVRYANDSAGTTITIKVMDRDTFTTFTTVTLAYGDFSAYYEVPSGNRRLLISSSISSAVDTVVSTYASNKQYTISLWNGAKPYALSSLIERDTYIDEGYRVDSAQGKWCAVKFINGIRDVASISVRLDSAGGTDVYGATFNTKTSSGYKKLAAGKTYNFSVVSGTEIAKVPVPVSAGLRYTVYLFGSKASMTYKIKTDDNK